MLNLELVEKLYRRDVLIRMIDGRLDNATRIDWSKTTPDTFCYIPVLGMRTTIALDQVRLILPYWARNFWDKGIVHNKMWANIEIAQLIAGWQHHPVVDGEGNPIVSHDQWEHGYEKGVVLDVLNNPAATWGMAHAHRLILRAEDTGWEVGSPYADHRTYNTNAAMAICQWIFKYHCERMPDENRS